MPKLNDQMRLARLQKHLECLLAGGEMSKRDMKSLLTEEQLTHYDDEWESRQAEYEWIKEGKESLADYEKLLKTADNIWSRYENTKKRNKKAETEYASQVAYEKALERLGELIDADPSIDGLLDRRFDGTTELTACAVPRHKLSRSHHTNPYVKYTKTDAKIETIELAIDEIKGGGLSDSQLSKADAKSKGDHLKAILRKVGE